MFNKILSGYRIALATVRSPGWPGWHRWFSYVVIFGGPLLIVINLAVLATVIIAWLFL